MKKRIITISREFGSGGRYIGEQIAKEMGIRFYDKDIIEQVEADTGMAKQIIEKDGEYAPVTSVLGYGLVGRNAKGQSVGDMLYVAQQKVIVEAAEKEPCVIVGRNADYILKDREDCINVFICGNMPEKMKRIKELYQLDERNAKKLMHDIDKKRSVHYKYYTEQEWGKASNYTLCLNSSVIGYNKCIELVIKLYKELAIQ